MIKLSRRSFLGGGIASILVVLLILVTAAFAALTYISAESRMSSSEKSRNYCDNYYAAETTASELLELISTGNSGSSTSGTKSVYETDAGSIIVTKAEKYVSFSVPVNKSQELQVEANVSKDSIDIMTGVVE